MSSFFKYSPNIFSQNFAVRKSVKRKFINESLEESQSDSEVVIETRKKRKAPLISESSEESQSDSEVVNPKRKTKPLLINETQEDDRFVIDEEYDTVIEK